MPEYPLFDGRKPVEESIFNFFEDLETIMEWKNIQVVRYPIILRRCLRSPAKEAYEMALATGAIAHNNVEGTPAENNNRAATNYQNSKTWLEARYHGAEQQAKMREALLQMRQGLDESPEAFYNRVAYVGGRSGLLDATLDILVAQTWKVGLNKTIALHLATLPTMNTANSVATAENYWNAFNGKVTQDLTRYPDTIPNDQ